jgi:predicted nucleotidyltransferase
MTDGVSIAAQQNRLQRELSRYINGCTMSRGARLLCAVEPRLAYRAHAPAVARHFAAFRDALPADAGADAVLVPVQPYAGTHTGVRRMMQALAPLRDILRGAYVHGSLATGEEMPYSDFDGLVIIRDAVVATPVRLARAGAVLNRLRLIMFDIDPLQHHGWFVLTESDLRFHCEAYFPVEIFRYTQSLIPGMGLELQLSPRDSRSEYRAVFDEGIRSVLRRSQRGGRPRNQFELKSLFSQIMLLPALYIQARHGRSVYKKDSFAEARRDFAPEAWAVMDEISAMRLAWQVDLSGPSAFALRRLLGVRRAATRWLAPPIPPALVARLTPDFWARVARLATGMRAGVGPAVAVPGERFSRS